MSNEYQKAASRFLLHLRPEARPSRHWGLDKAQQQAYLQILEFLSEATSGLSNKHQQQKPLGSEWLQSDRTSRLVFLSGARGTGKTTVLLSLAQDLTRARDSGENNEPDNFRDESVDALVRRVASRVLWLEPLDMESLPETANLLAAILARVEDAVQRYGGVQQSASKALGYGGGLMEPSGEYQEALLDLQRLQSDVALAWEGNLPERAGHLDPDIYAIEVMRAERVRLWLNQRFATCLDRLAGGCFTALRTENPIFVLCIDDFDINPAACLLLLRLLRMISVPRLFSIVLGDIDVATTMLNLKVSGDLAQIVGQAGQGPRGTKGEPPQYMMSIPPANVGNVAGEIAFNALRKLVPPSQRIYLEPLTPAEALRFCPFGQTSGTQMYNLFNVPLKIPVFQRGSENGALVAGLYIRTFSDLLFFRSVASFKISPRTVSTIADDSGKASYADAAAWTTDSNAEWTKIIEELPYQCKEIFRGSLRRTTDLWLQLQTLTEQEIASKSSATGEPSNSCPSISDRAVAFFADMAEQALEEDSAVAAVERSRLPLALGTGPTGVVNFNLLPIALQADSFDERRLTSAVYSENETSSGTLDVTHEVWGQLRVRRHRSFIFNVEMRDSVRSTLRADTAATLGLYHDLLVLTDVRGVAVEGRFSPALYGRPVPALEAGRTPSSDRSLATAAEEGHPWAVMAWRIGHESEPVRLPWPLPLFRSLWEYCLLLTTWNEFVLQVEPSSYRTIDQPIIEILAFAWINLATAIVGGEAPIDVRWKSEHSDSSVTADSDPPSVVEWEPLFRRLANMIDQNWTDKPRGRRIREWVTRLALMTIPEYGLGQKARESIAEAATVSKLTSKNEQSLESLKDLWEKEKLFLEDYRNRVHQMLEDKTGVMPRQQSLFLEYFHKMGVPDAVKEVFTRVIWQQEPSQPNGFGAKAAS